jgi:hypothetical protein
MANDPLEKIWSHIDGYKGNLKTLRLTFRLKILVVVAMLLIVSYQLFLVYVQPDQYGIKVVRVGLNRGVQKEVYQGGLTFVLPFGLQQMYRLAITLPYMAITSGKYVRFTFFEPGYNLPLTPADICR